MNVVALISTFNEAWVIGKTLEHLHRQGINFYLIDNESTDATPDIIRSFNGRGLAGMEILPRHGEFRWADILQRKEELSRTIDADWFIGADADEFRLPERAGERLVDTIARVDHEGYNIINFNEYVFVPTHEHPQHAPESFLETMRWYYRFELGPLFRSNTWKNGEGPVDLMNSGGHRAMLAQNRIYPRSLPMRHYLFISMDHFRAKYYPRKPATSGKDEGWHGWRKHPEALRFELPNESTLHRYDPAHPLEFVDMPIRREHIVQSSRKEA